MEAASGPDLHGTLERSLDLSLSCGAAIRSSKLLCLFGFVPHELMGDTASPWLIGTDMLQENTKALCREARRYLDKAQQLYPKLVNYVDARNAPSIRWLHRLGFTIDPAAPHGVQGLPFHRFHRGF